MSLYLPKFRAKYWDSSEDIKNINPHGYYYCFNFVRFLLYVQIKLWDVRVTKPVQEYKGHYNEHAYLPIHVNEPEGLLLAGKRGEKMLYQHSDNCETLQNFRC